MPAPLDDTFQLLERHRAGDPEALDLVMRRQYPRVERIVRIRLRARGGGGVHADIADVVQKTMMQAIQSLDQFEVREDARLIHWLARIAERQILTMDRHNLAACRDRRREVPLADGSGSTITPGAPPQASLDDSPSHAAAKDEGRQLLDNSLASLPDDQREVILLRDYAGASWDFIASELGRPSADAARKFHSRARADLAEKLRPMLDGES